MTLTRNRILSRSLPLDAARRLRDSMFDHQVPGIPLRLWPVIINAPEDDSYFVVESGFAAREGFEVIR